jgi:hypothetical protein
MVLTKVAVLGILESTLVLAVDNFVADLVLDLAKFLILLRKSGDMRADSLDKGCVLMGDRRECRADIMIMG